jgi:phosphopantothenoylcysteine decarboxylase/phosphopantothenate--cysteine ligase
VAEGNGVHTGMNAVVTCGPAYEPIDQARRLTNFSTGRLGATLADALAEAGWTVWCFRGEGATYPAPRRAHHVGSFSTNDDLAGQLERLSRAHQVGAVLHAAALCDYRVEKVLTSAGAEIRSVKFATKAGGLMLALAPATKVLPKLRAWCPQARLVGWKYELEGAREEALSKAWRQIQENQTDACVLNGAAYGEGYAFCTLPDCFDPCPDLAGLSRRLVNWLGVEPAGLPK